MSLIPVNNLSPVTTTPAKTLSPVTTTSGGQLSPVGDNDTGDKFNVGHKNKDAMEMGSCQGKEKVEGDKSAIISGRRSRPLPPMVSLEPP